MRFGRARAAAVAALVACLALLGVTLATLPLAGLYGALVLAGIGTHGTQCLILAAIADRYPAAVRGAALGFALGVGRVGAVVAPQVGGWMLARDLGVDANFVVFAAVAAIAGLLLHLIARRQRADVTDPTPEPTTPTVPAT